MTPNPVLKYPKRFLQWLTILLFTVMLLVMLGSFGLLHPIFNNDSTYLTYIIAGMAILTTALMGNQTFSDDLVHKRLKPHPVNSIRLLKQHWFVADTCTALGMVGTVIGFITMLNINLSETNVENIETVQTLMAQLVQGMYTALSTTLVGLVASIYLRTQAFFYNHG